MGYKICNQCDSTTIVEDVVDFCGNCRSYDIGYILPNGEKEIEIIDTEAIKQKYQNKEEIEKQATSEVDEELFINASSLALDVFEEFHKAYRVFFLHAKFTPMQDVMQGFLKQNIPTFQKKIMYAYDPETTGKPISDLRNGKIKTLENFIVRYKLLVDDNKLKNKILEYLGFCPSNVAQQEAKKNYQYLLSKRKSKINARIKELTN